jgi:hypothetical protein
MNAIFALLEFGDYAAIAMIVFFTAGAGSLVARRQINLRRLERKLDLLLQHNGITLPTPLSPEAQLLAKDPSKKIAAIKLHRRQNPGLGLAEAKADVEEFAP